VLSINTSTSAVRVMEGATATFQLRLTAAPGPAGLVVAVNRTSGDDSIEVQSGNSLVFTRSNWSTYQTVTLLASPDPDAVNGQAVIRCSAAGVLKVDVIATEQDNTSLSIDLDRTTLVVPEGQTASFGVRLGYEPAGDVPVNVSFYQGDSDLSVVSGGSLVFTPADWNVYQNVSVAAAPDDDASNSQALIRCMADGVPVREVIVAEQDDDTLAIQADRDSITIPEDGTAAFSVRLSAQPAGEIVVQITRGDGDSDISVVSGSTLVFTRSNWNVYQEVALAAAEDADMRNGQATIRCTAPGLDEVTVTAVEQDTVAVSPVPAPSPLESTPEVTPPEATPQEVTPQTSAPLCGGGAAGAALACFVAGLVSRGRRRGQALSNPRRRAARPARGSVL
jgi:hypothetical protein